MMLQKVKNIYSESIQIQIAASSMLSENIACLLYTSDAADE